MSIYQFNNFHNFDIFKKLEGKCATQCGDDNGTISQLGRRILNVQATTTQKFKDINIFNTFRIYNIYYKHDNGTISQLGRRILNVQTATKQKLHSGSAKYKYIHIKGHFELRVGNILLFGSSKRSVGGRTSKYFRPKCILARGSRS